MTDTQQPFDDIRALVDRMPAGNMDAALEVSNAIDPMLGRLGELASWLARWRKDAKGPIVRPVAAVFAGNHGITAHDISARAADSTEVMLDEARNGKAPINALCAANDVGLKLFELALEHPAADFTKETSLDERDCAATVAFGMEAVSGGADLLCVGEMGVGNTTAASALCAALFGGTGVDWAASGSGTDDSRFAAKVRVIDAALALHGDLLQDPLQALRCLGGRELAAIAGAIIAARFEQIPVIIDGFVASAAAAVLYKLSPHALDHCVFAHCSAETPHDELLDRMGEEPLLSLAIREGQACGAVLAVPLVRSAQGLVG